MKKIIIFGTGGHMREQIEWLNDLMDYERVKYDIILCSEKKVYKNYDIISEKKNKKKYRSIVFSNR